MQHSQRVVLRIPQVSFYSGVECETINEVVAGVDCIPYHCG